MFIYSQPVVLYVTKKKKNKTFEMMLSRMRQFLQISDCLGITKLALKSNILLHRQIEKSHDKILSYSFLIFAQMRVIFRSELPDSCLKMTYFWSLFHYRPISESAKLTHPNYELSIV